MKELNDKKMKEINGGAILVAIATGIALGCAVHEFIDGVAEGLYGED